jgi:hypothetical protein
MTSAKKFLGARTQLEHCNWTNERRAWEYYEGFGALDATTLNVTIDALERLPSMGRRIGTSQQLLPRRNEE